MEQEGKEQELTEETEQTEEEEVESVLRTKHVSPLYLKNLS